METTIHNITKIELGELEKSVLASGHKFYTRKVYFYKDNDLVLSINCFADSEEGLRVKIKQMVNI